MATAAANAESLLGPLAGAPVDTSGKLSSTPPAAGAPRRHRAALGHDADEAAAAQHEESMLAQLRSRVLAPQPLAVVVQGGAAAPRRRFAFHARACTDSAAKARALVVTEHCDGAKFCEDLFGHFLLPNGRLAHFYYRVRSPAHVACIPTAVYIAAAQSAVSRL